MRLRHLLPKCGEDLQIEIERALQGRGCRDRETNNILLMKIHGLSWGELMALPYRILLKMQLMKKVEVLLGGAHG